MKVRSVIEIILLSFFILLLIHLFLSNKMSPSVETLITNRPMIPFNIFQTWETKNIPPNMKSCMEKIKRENPEFKYYLYDNYDCENFISIHFDIPVLNAYKRLIPGAYKADLWRCCVLYIHGGIYLDAKMKPTNGFRFKQLTDGEYFVRDMNYSGKGIWNGFIVSKQNNPILKRAIYDIVDNVNNKFYGNSALEPTGPLLLKKYFTEDEIDNLKYELNYINGMFLITTKYNPLKNAILEKDNFAAIDQVSTSTVKRYNELWVERKIYIE